MELKYSLLENGLDFVLNSINNLSIASEYDPDEYTRSGLIKYSLLHLSSGIELVLKARLFKEHWTYVFADMNNAKQEHLITGEFKSVDNETILKRLDNFCGIKFHPKDILTLKKLRKKRNRAEHFAYSESILSVESSIHKSISILISLLVTHYNIDEFSEEENALFIEIKDTMKRLTKHYHDVKTLTHKMLEQSGMKSYANICPECQEMMLVRDDDVKCYFCDYEDSGEDAARNYIYNIMGIDEYSIVKDGGDYPLYECPACDRETFVVDYPNERALCFSCDFECDITKIDFCSYCGGVIYDRNDEGIFICNSCLKYKLDDDN